MTASAATRTRPAGRAEAVVLAGSRVRGELLDERQFTVVRGACAAAGFPIGRRPARAEPSRRTKKRRATGR